MRPIDFDWLDKVMEAIKSVGWKIGEVIEFDRYPFVITYLDDRHIRGISLGYTWYRGEKHLASGSIRSITYDQAVKVEQYDDQYNIKKWRKLSARWAFKELSTIGWVLENESFGIFIDLATADICHNPSDCGVRIDLATYENIMWVAKNLDSLRRNGTLRAILMQIKEN